MLQNGLPNVDQLIALAAPANLYEGNSRDSIFRSRLFGRGRKHAHFDFELDSVTVTPVPLPASGLFLLTGLGGLLVTGRRRLGR